MRLPVGGWLRTIRAVLVAVLLTLVLGPPLIVISLFEKTGSTAYLLTRLWARLLSRSMGLTFSIQGTEKIAPSVSYIIAPNHQGYVDILALITTLPPRFRWVLKRELLRIPLFGWALGRTGAISLDRSNREQAMKSLVVGASKLTGGWSVLIYPEGTRTPDGNLQHFKKGAFIMAIQTGIPILPVTCNGAYKIMPKKTIVFQPGHITVTVGDPIPSEGLTEADVGRLLDKTRAAVGRHLDTNYDPFRRREQERVGVRGTHTQRKRLDLFYPMMGEQSELGEVEQKLESVREESGEPWT
ncbi:MAG: 1-acyl-sn-glycerol-3-phosphate acyltransferase [Deltaproteobacteria bacterium HGW-Deltaproteobacteria-21]|nr:MAG: 1-acyl-sn-glycerol-3-phosphate acyltransferase [Deltaproteobacteria bacterium HGW-Deltaproteobacteria-21]